MPIRRTRSDFCACEANGHAAAIPPSAQITSRRWIWIAMRSPAKVRHRQLKIMAGRRGCLPCDRSEKGHSRLGGASWRSGHVRNAPLATVGPKKAACRDGPRATFCTAARSTRCDEVILPTALLRDAPEGCSCGLGSDSLYSFYQAQQRLLAYRHEARLLPIQVND